jgi:hypothetical protein
VSAAPPPAPQLTKLLVTFLTPIGASCRGKGRDCVLKEAGKRRTALVVFLEHYLLQLYNHELGFEEQALFRMYALAQSTMNRRSWKAEASPALKELLRAAQDILFHWADVVGATYVSNSANFSALLHKRIPLLLRLAAAHASARGEVALAAGLSDALSRWEETFDVG